MDEPQRTQAGGLLVVRSGYGTTGGRGRAITIRLSGSVCLGLMAGSILLLAQPQVFRLVMIGLLGACLFMPFSHLSHDKMPVLYLTRLGVKTLAFTAGYAIVLLPVAMLGTWALVFPALGAVISGFVAIVAARFVY